MASVSGLDSAALRLQRQTAMETNGRDDQAAWEEEVMNALIDEPTATVRELVDRFSGRRRPTTVRAFIEDLLGKDETLRRRISESDSTLAVHVAKQRKVGVSRGAILEALRAAAEEQGLPLTRKAYDASTSRLHAVGSVRIMQIFGTWTAACLEAGVEPVMPHASRTYARRWSADEAADWVARFLIAEPNGSHGGYDVWTRTHDGAPGAGTVRGIFGGWARAVHAAYARISAAEEPQAVAS